MYVNNILVDKYQEKAILCLENCLLIAGAGAGKTFTILGKINYLLENKIYQENQILIISFTNKSVEDLQKKITNQIAIFTFHKLAMTILKENNIEFKIASDNLLNFLADEFFQSLTNENLKKEILKKYQEYDYNIFLKTTKYHHLLNNIITYIHLFKTNNCTMKDLKKSFAIDSLTTKLILIIEKLYKEELSSTGQMDFDDLIKKAIDILEKPSKYKLIIIDEFQDTSLLRWNLIEKILTLNKAKIFAVGDDFQSIYHFTGCNVDLFLDFAKIVPNAQILKLKYTYRNSQQLIDAAGKFILKNPRQVDKDLKSNKNLPHPIKYKTYLFSSLALTSLLDHLIKNYSDILILGRNNKDIYPFLNSQITYTKEHLIYKNQKIRYLTVHSSKGLEADVVILINLVDSPTGFPSKLKEPKLIANLNPLTDNFLNSEERRLFYVALTRTKNEVYLLCPLFRPSIFVKELKKITKKEH